MCDSPVPRPISKLLLNSQKSLLKAITIKIDPFLLVAYSIQRIPYTINHDHTPVFSVYTLFIRLYHEIQAIFMHQKAQVYRAFVRIIPFHSSFMLASFSFSSLSFYHPISYYITTQEFSHSFAIYNVTLIFIHIIISSG